MNNLKNILKAIIPLQFRPWIKQFVFRIAYFGKRYYCPVCKSYTRLQKPLGLEFPVIKEKQIVGAGLRTALCPVCGSSDRIRLLYLFFKLKTNLFCDPLRLLHFAPEPSLQHIFEKHKNIQYLTADLYQADVMEKIDITRIQYPENSFDAIICNHVLEHIPDDALAMNELYRVLKPKGWAVLQVPVSKLLKTTFEDPSITNEADREIIFGQKDHIRIYGKDYSEKLVKAGFKVQEFSWVHDQETVFQNQKINLNKDEVVFYCLK